MKQKLTTKTNNNVLLKQHVKQSQNKVKRAHVTYLFSN